MWFYCNFLLVIINFMYDKYIHSNFIYPFKDFVDCKVDFSSDLSKMIHVFIFASWQEERVWREFAFENPIWQIRKYVIGMDFRAVGIHFCLAWIPTVICGNDEGTSPTCVHRWIPEMNFLALFSSFHAWNLN